MGKIKIHEIAKELDLPSKDIIDKAKELGYDVKSHLSNVEEEEAEKIKEAFGKKKSSKKAVSEVNNVQKEKKEKTETPVIIRREVILSDDEKKETEKKEQKPK